MKHKKGMYVIVALFSFLLLLSLRAASYLDHYEKGKQMSNIMLVKEALLLVVLYGSCIITIKALHWLANHFVAETALSGEVDYGVKRSRLLLYAILPFCVFFIYFIAFYPCVTCPDGIIQWRQIAGQQPYHDWHPVVHTLVMKLVTLFWHSPAAFSLFQMIVMSLVFGYFSYVFEKYGVRRAMIWFVLGCVSLLPINGIYSVTMWKDILYSTMICLFSVLAFQMIYTKGQWLHTRGHQVLFTLTALAVVFFRHNGIYVFVGWLLIMALTYKKKWKQVYGLGAAVIFSYVVVTGPLYTVYNIQKSPVMESLSVPLQQMAAVVTYKGKLSQEQQQYLDCLMPMKAGQKKYTAYLADPIKNRTQPSVYHANPRLFFKHWYEIIANNPSIAGISYIKLSSIIWCITPLKDSYTSRCVLGIEPKRMADATGLANIVFFPQFTHGIKNMLHKNFFGPFFSKIWRPALYLMIILLFIVADFARRRSTVLLSSLPVLLNTFSIAVALPAQDFRYLYATLLVLPVLLLVVLVSVHRSLLERRKEGVV